MTRDLHICTALAALILYDVHSSTTEARAEGCSVNTYHKQLQHPAETDQLGRFSRFLLSNKSPGARPRRRRARVARALQAGARTLARTAPWRASTTSSRSAPMRWSISPRNVWPLTLIKERRGVQQTEVRGHQRPKFVPASPDNPAVLTSASPLRRDIQVQQAQRQRL